MSHPAPAGNVYPAPGKLNLFLHVVGRRPDGYHLLQTMFRFIDAADELRIAVRDDGQVRRAATLPGVPEEADLTVRAARALQAATGCRLGADIELDKRLPMGGGVGGGSSDAATTLIALNRLWDLGLRRRELMEIGLGLGADVPIFLFGRSAFAEGIGEQLAAVEIAPAWYVLLTPQVHVATAEIFADPALTRDSEAIKIPAFFTGAGRNDLEPVVCRKYPEVAAHLQWLALYGEARMTGSGACVFAAFPEEEQARQVLDQLPRWMNGLVVRGMDEHPLLGLVPD